MTKQEELRKLDCFLATLRDEHGIQTFCTILIPEIVGTGYEFKNVIYGKDKLSLFQAAEKFMKKEA